MRAGTEARTALCKHLAGELEASLHGRTPVEPITARHPDLTLDEAYAVQRCLRARALSAGRVLAGHKIGATSTAIRELFDIDQPDAGFLLHDMLVPSGASVDTRRLIAPKVEGEIAFRLAQDVEGTGITRHDVLDATAGVVPVLEVLDSRIRDWAIRLIDTVADNASSAMAVLGSAVDPRGIDLAAEPVELVVDGVAYYGTGAEVLGHPAESVAWLAATLAHYGERLSAGQIVLAGSWTPAVTVGPGSSVRATFASIGTVSLTMGPGPSDPDG